ncbi:DUF5133 domain-containing protein [Streptomyces sp. 8N706]|uniref:DUF5133 domain-containing protein n=1 Tax=Streptomyces sp. 8N706 TaxID=3457416 RepID=UPI003FD31C04
MLMAHPAVLKNLVERYEALAVLDAGRGGPEVRQEFEDVAYAMCVSTGTQDAESALVAARHQLPGARTLDDSVLSS